MEKDRGGGEGEKGGEYSTTLAPLFLLNPLASTNLVGRREEGEATLMRGSPPPEGRREKDAKGTRPRGKEKKKEEKVGGRPVLLRQRKQGKMEGGGEKFKGKGGGSQMGKKRRSHFECRLHFTRSP